MNYPIKISLMKQQFVITHTICQTEILALLDSSVTNAPSIKILCLQNNGLFHKYLTCLSVGLSRIQVFSVFRKLCIDGLQQTAVPWKRYVIIYIHLVSHSMGC
jgi:hypothetical protein